MVFYQLVDKIDVELLWVLQQSSSQPLSLYDMKKKNKILSKNDDDLLNKLQSMEENGFVKINNTKDDNETNYTITKTGIDLIWKGDTWEPIFNLIKLVESEKYTSNEIRRITNKSLVDCVTNIEFLRKKLNLIEGQSKRFKLYFVLTEKGKSYEPKFDK